ncbi:MAG: tRNA adenosine(34) deaminase TadA [Lachnospiraceae bacterium]|nr:tRNA adenosine(34) deaminase TadA [Lachnospiraceae bacterium]
MKEKKKNSTIVEEKYMREAIRQAKKAAVIREVPIGCVIVYQDKIIARGYNKRNSQKTTLGHAEILAIQKASKKLGDWRLEDCTMYITLEPCPMCAGAIVQARIPRVVIGAMNPKAGCAGSILNLLQVDRFNHQAEVVKGILEKECQELMKQFFRQLREEKNRLCLEKNAEVSAQDSLDKTSVLKI